MCAFHWPSSSFWRVRRQLRYRCAILIFRVRLRPHSPLYLHISLLFLLFQIFLSIWSLFNRFKHPILHLLLKFHRNCSRRVPCRRWPQNSITRGLTHLRDFLRLWDAQHFRLRFFFTAVLLLTQWPPPVTQANNTPQFLFVFYRRQSWLAS